MTALRVLVAVAERGSFTAAASSLGYTQSAVSRQAAALERAFHAELYQRRPDGVRLTAAGLLLLGHTRTALGELALASRALSTTTEPVAIVRIGLFTTAAATLLPDLARNLADIAPRVRLNTRDGTSPALVRSVRAGSLDLAVITSRPPHRSPDADIPRLRVDVLHDDHLVVAAPAKGRFAGRTTIRAEELSDQDWIASPSSSAEPSLGVWPGMPGRPRIAHISRDWMVKLRLVAAGHGVTTVAESIRDALPDGIALLTVTDMPPEIRRVSVVRLPQQASPEIATVVSQLSDLFATTRPQPSGPH